MTDAELILRTLIVASVPLTLRELSERTGMPRRACERAVQELRRASEPICSDGRGIRLGTTSSETRRAADRLRQRALEQMETAAAPQAPADATAAREISGPGVGRGR